jgi:hypothetical protein
MLYNPDTERPVLAAVFPSHWNIQFRRYVRKGKESVRDQDFIELTFQSDGEEHTVTMTRYEFETVKALVEQTDDLPATTLEEA